MQIRSVLSIDLLAVICRSARFYLQMCSVMYAGLLSVFCRSSQRCLKICLVFSANLLGFVFRLARCCQEIFISVNQARPCLVQGVNYLVLSRVWSLPFISIALLVSLHLYVLFCLTNPCAYSLFPSFYYCISKPLILQRVELGVPFNLNLGEQTIDSKFSQQPLSSSENSNVALLGVGQYQLTAGRKQFWSKRVL